MKRLISIALNRIQTLGVPCVRSTRSILQLVFLSLFFLTGGAQIASSQIVATIESSQDQGYGRLVFDFAEMPSYNVLISSNVLVITFDKPVGLDITLAERGLSSFVSAGRVDPDNLGVRFALSRTVSVNTMEAGIKLFVDLMPEGWQGLPPSLPPEVVAELTRRAEEAEAKARREALEALELESGAEISVTAGEHPTFSRIMFNWNVPFSARFTREGDEVSIAFNKLAVSDLRNLVSSPPTGLVSISSERTERGLVINLEVERGVTLRAFTDRNSYVVDLTDAARGPGSALGLSNENLDQLGFTQIAEDVVDPPSAEPGADNTPADATSIAVSTEVFNPAELAETDYADWTEGQFSVADNPEGEIPKEREQGVQRATDESTNESGSNNMEDQAELVLITEDRPALDRANPADTVPVIGQEIAQGVKIEFKFPDPVRAAVFQRNGSIWAVFDSRIPINLGDLAGRFSSRLLDARVVRSGDMQYVRLDLKVPSLTSVVGRNQSWFVTIGDLALDAPTPLEIRRERGADGLPRAVVNLDDSSRLLWLEDPSLGERIAVVTAFGPARGLIKRQEFVEFIAFPSAHGLAIQPLADDLDVSIQIDEVIITRSRGLWLSAAGNIAVARELEELARTRPGFIDFDKFLAGGPSTYLSRRRQLLAAAAVSSDEERTIARFELARFFLAYNLAPEALAVLRQIEVDGERLGRGAILSALTGIANVMMARTHEADVAFRAPGVGNGPEITLWRGLNEGLKGDWLQAQKNIEDGETLIWDYPDELRARMHLAAARGALERNDFEAANHHLAVLEDINGDAAVYAERQYLRGRYLEETGRYELAKDAYDLAIGQEIRPISTEARLYKISLMIADDSIERAEAVRRLEGVSMGWRGNNVELQTLNVLADLYSDTGNFERLFEVMQSASVLNADDKIVEELRNKIDVAFRELFLDGGADAMSPIDALSLFYEYRVLTPIGREGDVIIRKLADRLVSVDLLEQAAELLTHQVDNRLEGVARAQVAVRLASVLLMNRNPAEAIRVLRRTRLAELPASVRRQRKLIEARAYSESGRMELALDILSVMEGDDVERQKADTLWQARAWQEAADQLERTLGDAWKQDEPLDDDQRYDVMRAAVSYALAGDNLGLQRLRTKFSQAMSDSPDSHAFQIVTGPIQPDATEFRELARQIASIDTLEAFLADMQSRDVSQFSELGDPS
jgi:tetratricopeptide (TPR) repeat protein